MILYELTNSEQHPVYQDLEVSNGSRQYDFLRSTVTSALGIGRPYLSQTVIRALNFHAIACLHTNAGEYRPCPVIVGDPAKPTECYHPPDHYRVQALMDDLVNQVNRYWEKQDAILLAAFVLWRLNHVHPFINGNGRTARAASYFVLCLKLGGLLPGAPILPELLRQNRTAYVAALKQVDQSSDAGKLDLTPVQTLISSLLQQQLASAAPTAAQPP